MRLSRELVVALQAVHTASRATLGVQQSLKFTDSITKADHSPVTVADFASQAIISYFLSQSDVTKNDFIVGEEEASALRADPLLSTKVVLVIQHALAHIPATASFSDTYWLDLIDRANGAKPSADSSKRYWTIDPVDGTKGFLRQQQFAVCLALLENDQVQLGVLGCPNLLSKTNSGIVSWAVVGHGAYQVDLSVPISDMQVKSERVSTAKDPSSILLLESYESSHTNHALSSSIAARMGVTEQPIRIDSQCKYGEVARGNGHMYLRILSDPNYQEKIWDHAAGSLIVTEAGGNVTDLLGMPLKFSVTGRLNENVGVLATSGSAAFHRRALEAIHADPGFEVYKNVSSQKQDNFQLCNYVLSYHKPI